MVAFDAGNLKPVAEAVRNLFPNVEITICADNDHANKINVGVDKAVEAARAVNAMVLVPEFTEEEKRLGLTDFNDLAKSRGLPAVAKFLIFHHKDSHKDSHKNSHQNSHQTVPKNWTKEQSATNNQVEMAR